MILDILLANLIGVAGEEGEQKILTLMVFRLHEFSSILSHPLKNGRIRGILFCNRFIKGLGIINKVINDKNGEKIISKIYKKGLVR